MTRRWIFAAVAIFAAALSAHAGTYYVSLSGNNGNTGTSPGTGAWRTITYAAQQASAGDAVYIEGGNYGNENGITFARSGNSTAPIVFEGYNGTPVLAYDYRTTRTAPVTGFSITSRSYITLRNIEMATYYQCIYLTSSNHITLDNIYCHDCGSVGAYGYGIVLSRSNYNTIVNCRVQDCGGNNFCVSNSDYNTFDNCQTLGTYPSSDAYATDYYFVLSWASYNTITNCYANDTANSGKGNHGFIIKDGGSDPGHGHSTGNTFTNCAAYSFEEALSCAHGAYGNTFTDCLGDSSQKNYYFSNGITVRDGAHDNTFNNCRGIGGGDGSGGEALCMYVANEGAVVDIQANNHFNNCVFEARDRNHTSSGPLCIYLCNAQNNIFDKCTFLNATYFARFRRDSDGTEQTFGNTFSNCTIYNTGGIYDTRTLSYPWAYYGMGTVTGYDDTADFTFTNCNFYQNGFATPAGNMSFEPFFIDPASGNYLVPFGSLSVTLGPAAAVTNGAAWRRVGQPTWRAGASTETDIMGNVWPVEFMPIPHWITPAQQSVTIGSGLSTLSAVYLPAQVRATYLAGVGGRVNGATSVTQLVDYGTTGPTVTATGNPPAQYHFVNWSDAITANPRTDANVTTDVTVTANFDLNAFTLNYAAGANGTINGTTPQTVTYGGSGTQVTAVPNAHYHFVKWSDNVMTAARTDTNVTTNATVTATFAIDQFTLTYSASAGGTLIGASPQTVNYGGNGTQVTAIPNAYYHFVKWSDNVMTAPRTDKGVTANINVTASFAIDQYTLSYTADAGGSISGQSLQTVNTLGSGTAVTAVPSVGYLFLRWDDGSTANPRTDTSVTSNISVKALFTPCTAVWVDFGYTGAQSGTQTNPFITLASGLTAAPSRGLIKIKTGSTSTPIRVTKPMRIESSGGTARIGR